MSIKLRLLLAFAATFLVPLVLTVLIMNSMRLYYTVDFAGEVEYKGETYVLSNQVDFFVFLGREINRVILDEPAKMEDPVYLDKLNSILKKMNVRAVIRKAGRFINADPAALPDEKNFASFGQLELLGDKYPGRPMVLYQWDFYFDGKIPGSFFVIRSDEEGAVLPGENMFFILVVIFISILTVTNGVMTFLVSRSIIKPLKALETATREIQQGNLDFSPQYKKNNEIGRVCDAFDKMRLYLKDSIEKQRLYEVKRKELISNISHDLRTPVTAIKGYIQGIKDGIASTPEKTEKYLDTIYVKAAHIEHLTEELMFFSRLDLKQFSFNFACLNISKYLTDLTEELAFDYEKQNVKLECRVPADFAVWINGDGENLKRVITNIIENSVKYSGKEQTEVRILLEEKEDWALIRITDNGPGIPADVMPFVFDRFYRADPARNSNRGGTGLGLAIARQIMEAHGGEINAESHDGEGAVIRLSFPLYRESEHLKG